MMMDCPRCGFSQPKDRFCASCGVDVEQFLLRPTPLWRRVLANPNTYVFLVGVLLALAAAYIVTTRVPAVWRAARGSFVSSREAADPDQDDESTWARPPEPETAATPPAADSVAAEVAAPAPVAADSPKPATPEPRRLETEFWEVARPAAIDLLSSSERIAEDQEGRAYLIHDPERVGEWLRGAARPLGPGFREPIRVGAEIVVETPPAAAESLRFGLAVQVARFENARGEIRFVSSLSLMQPETATEASPNGPAMRAVINAGLRGHADLAAGDTLVLLIQPVNRRPRAEFIDRAGPGPWGIFASPNFRAGETDWIATVRLR